MAENLKVKEQFNKQASNFDNWSITQSEKIHRSTLDFFGIEAEDRVLDVACGTGAFAIYTAQMGKLVRGVDISDKMIEIAIENAKQKNLTNIEFLCCDVEKIPFEADNFDLVMSKSAFHHMANYQRVFQEMKRCVKKRGRIGIGDIVAYDDPKLDDFFEELEREVDPSHNRTLSKQQFVDLYQENNLEITRSIVTLSEFKFYNYVNHAVQTEKSQQKIDSLLKLGLQDKDISQWFVTKNDALYWKRNVIAIAGLK